MNDSKPVVVCNKCHQVLITASAPIKISFGKLSCHKCGSDELLVQGKFQKNDQVIVIL